MSESLVSRSGPYFFGPRSELYQAFNRYSGYDQCITVLMGRDLSDLPWKCSTTELRRLSGRKIVSNIE
ncbi:MAG: hypothetical protein Q8P45_03195 [Candidatus Harrisonbacteria bacterium]|nr:hypothetical protein [Candidatus Harrisonbacteria bacterium]